MDQRISFLTLAVRNLDATRAFYLTGLGWRAELDPVYAAAEREWGGYTGYFGDPDGFRWEVAWNPGRIGEMVLP